MLLGMPVSGQAVALNDEQLLDALKHHFGHEAFRPMQLDVVRDVLAGRDVQVIMPTGGGKSLCYQLPAVLRDGVTVVISPLIALMQDQVEALTAAGIKATFLNSTLDGRQRFERERAAMQGEYDLLYMAPERLMSDAGRQLLARLNVTHFAIDEAHCISEWGHDFRPEYRMLGELRSRFDGQFRDVPVMALTATATPRVADDIVAQLHLDEVVRYHGGFERTNLYYEVRPKRQTTKQIVEYIKQRPDAEGIVYCLSRASVESLAAKLQAEGVAALPYHAGLESAQRQKHQHAFVYGDAQVIVATIAFGMGVDKPDVRFVMHADLPRHLEGYYQETGRAGRDGIESDCILFFSAGDRQKLERFIEQKSDEAERKHAYWQLSQMCRFAYETGCRMKPLLAYFGEEHAGDCGHCDNCRIPPQLDDATEDAQKLLSAVARTQQRYGVSYVVDVLCGADSDRVKQRGHETLSVFGIGADRPKAHWRRVAETLVASGQLAQVGDEFPTLQLTEDSMPVLRGETRVSIVRPRAMSKTRSSKQRSVRFDDEGLAIDEACLAALRRVRGTIAKQSGLPPYMIFGYASLREMAARKPTTLKAFREINGVVDHKLRKYGEVFVEAIQPFAD